MEFDPTNLVLSIALFITLVQRFLYKREAEGLRQAAMSMLAWIYLHNNAELPSVDEVQDAYKQLFEEEDKKCQVQ